MRRLAGLLLSHQALKATCRKRSSIVPMDTAGRKKALSFVLARLPTILVGLALIVAIVTARGYLGNVDLQTIHAVDAEHLSRLDMTRQQSYLNYRQHDVDPETA